MKRTLISRQGADAAYVADSDFANKVGYATDDLIKINGFGIKSSHESAV